MTPVPSGMNLGERTRLAKGTLHTAMREEGREKISKQERNFQSSDIERSEKGFAIVDRLVLTCQSLRESSLRFLSQEHVGLLKEQAGEGASLRFCVGQRCEMSVNWIDLVALRASGEGKREGDKQRKIWTHITAFR